MTRRTTMPALCVIFDLDGTLVDSESLCNQALLDLVPGLNDPVERLVARYRGMKLAAILSDVEERAGAGLPVNFEATYRSRVAERFALELKPVPGAREMLEKLACAKCLASSGPRAKIEQALAVSGLARFFEQAIFSSYEVGSWKPEPGLFLHAARAMGFAPEHCVVVEDSDVGIQAARAAGMMALHYVGAEAGRGGSGARQFSDMQALPDHLAVLSKSL
jgi:HAD superfamily hydrolase (TIGR01509 family)